MNTILKTGGRIVGNFLILGLVTASSAFLAVLASEMTTKVIETALETFTSEKSEETRTDKISNVA